MFRKLLKRELTFPKMKAKNRDEMFEIFAERAFKSGLVKSKEDFYKALQDRESQGSTEVVPGIALPHTKHESINETFVMIATSKKGIKFHGFSKVKLIFCMGAPKGDPVYMNLMARTARLLKKKEFVDKIIQSDVHEDIINTIFSYEERIGASEEKGLNNLSLVILTLNDEDAEMAFPLFLELGIRNATILSSSNLYEKFYTEIPLFSAFSFAKQKSYNSKTMIGLSDDEKISSKLNTLLKEEGIDLWKPGKGMLFSIKVNNVFGGINPAIDI